MVLLIQASSNVYLTRLSENFGDTNNLISMLDWTGIEYREWKSQYR